MRRARTGWCLSGAMVFLGLIPAAHAQWAVVDVGAITQLIQQVKTAVQQLETAQNQLTQAQQQFQSLTGSRGMQNLLSGTVRNYLPTNSASLLATLTGTGGYGALGGSVQSALTANAVLSPAALSAMSPAERTAIQTQRQSTALLQGVSQQALLNSSSRFASVQQLIGTIGTASDPKAILDLQARISAELGMLQNEQTKLQVLYQTVAAQAAAGRLRASEQAVADVGSLRSLPAMGLR